MPSAEPTAAAETPATINRRLFMLAPCLRVQRSISARCCGKVAASVSRLPISKTAKSNPRATSQPTRAYAPSAGTCAANQDPGRIAVCQRFFSPMTICSCRPS